MEEQESDQLNLEVVLEPVESLPVLRTVGDLLERALRRAGVDPDADEWWSTGLWSDRSRRGPLTLVTVAGFVLPVVAYFAFVGHYALNVVLDDQWSDVALIGHAFSGHLSWSDLWAQHNENRILFPNLIVLTLAYTTHLDVRVEEYLSAVLLVGSVLLLIWTHRRRSPATPMFWYCPVVILMLSWAQYQNSLWGFQLAWYLVLACLASSLALLDLGRLSLVALTGSMILAVVGSYSSLQGLLIWPAGLLLLLYRRRPWPNVVAWVASAIVTTCLYLDNLRHSVEFNPLAHPLTAAKLFVYSLGDVVGRPVVVPHLLPTAAHPLLGSPSPWIIALGLVILVGAVLAVVKAGIRPEGAEPLGVALILVGLACIALTVIGRGDGAYVAMSQSRYTMFSLLVVTGSYLVVIARPAHRLVVPALLKFALPAVVATSVGAAIIAGYWDGLVGAREDHSVQTMVAQLAKGQTQTPKLLFIANPIDPRPVAIHLIHIAREQRLGGFVP